MKAGQRETFDDCGACIRGHGIPDLMDDNIQAWGLYQALQSQVRAGLSVGGVDMAVLPVMLDAWEIPHGRERRELIAKFQMVDREYCEHRAAEEKRREQRSKSKSRMMG